MPPDRRPRSLHEQAAEDLVRDLFAQMLRNAAAMLDLLEAAQVVPDPVQSAAFEDSMRLLRGKVRSHTAKVAALKIEQGLKREEGERRGTIADRREGLLDRRVR